MTDLEYLQAENQRLKAALKLAHDWMFNGKSTPFLREVEPAVKSALGLPIPKPSNEE